MTEQLKPCPFCGSNKNVSLKCQTTFTKGSLFWVECDCGVGCGAECGEFNNPIDAILSWGLKEMEQLQARIKELESENQQTEMTVHEAQEYAWKMVKIDCGLHHITVGELSVYYAFFLHGWNYATQYHKQTNKKIINEIKAQGIGEAIKGFRTFAISNNVNLTCEDFDEYLCEQINKLRSKHDK